VALFWVNVSSLKEKWECWYDCPHGSESASLSKAGMLTSLAGVSSTHLREHTSMLSLRGNVGWAALNQSIARALAAYATSLFLIEGM